MADDCPGVNDSTDLLVQGITQQPCHLYVYPPPIHHGTWLPLMVSKYLPNVFMASTCNFGLSDLSVGEKKHSFQMPFPCCRCLSMEISKPQKVGVLVDGFWYNNSRIEVGGSNYSNM